MKEEIWRPIEGFGGAYEVSNIGRVRNVNGKILSTREVRGGYLRVSLSFKGKTYQRSVHRLVAYAFIPNPNGHPQINHKDEDKKNNVADNLEWCTAKYNSNYGTRLERLKGRLKKPIAQYDLDGNLIAIHPSLREAADAIGVKYVGGIGVAANRHVDRLGHLHQIAYGFRWRYIQDQKIDEQ